MYEKKTASIQFLITVPYNPVRLMVLKIWYYATICNNFLSKRFKNNGAYSLWYYRLITNG